MTYALGRGVEYKDMPQVRSIVRESAANNYSFSSIVLGIVKQPLVPDEPETRRRYPAGGPLVCAAGETDHNV